MTRSVVVPFQRHTRTSLDRLLDRVAAPSREFAANLMCVRQHDHAGGGCIEAPRGYWPRPVTDSTPPEQAS